MGVRADSAQSGAGADQSARGLGHVEGGVEAVGRACAVHDDRELAATRQDVAHQARLQAFLLHCPALDLVSIWTEIEK
eukprot:1004258-Rhodomonas_salina.1